MSERKREGYGRCHISDHHPPDPGNGKSPVSPKSPEMFAQATAGRPADTGLEAESVANHRAIAGPLYEIVEGWILPCPT